MNACCLLVKQGVFKVRKTSEEADKLFFFFSQTLFVWIVEKINKSRCTFLQLHKEGSIQNFVFFSLFQCNRLCITNDALLADAFCFSVRKLSLILHLGYMVGVDALLEQQRLISTLFPRFADDKRLFIASECPFLCLLLITSSRHFRVVSYFLKIIIKIRLHE